MTSSAVSSRRSSRDWGVVVAEDFVITMSQVHKVYGDVAALRGFDLDVPRGAICGFLGRNGAGKTTALKILLGMARPTNGDARVLGLRAGDPGESIEIRRRTAFVGEERILYPAMTVAEMIRFAAGFFPTWRADLERRYTRKFELPLDRKVKVLSPGTRAKLALLLALCRGAELLLLDEPTSALDPASAEEVLQALVAHAADENTTILFSSHHIAEIEQIADWLSIIESGRSVVAGALDDVREKVCRVDIIFADQPPEMTLVAPGIQRIRRQGRVVTVLATRGAGPVIEEARALNPMAVDVVPLNLKEIFLATVAGED